MSPESFPVPNISFLSEQDGLAERRLKARLVERLGSNVYVLRLYLARVRYGNSAETKVALCVQAERESDAQTIVEVASHEFKNLFKTTESLDILFLSPTQQAEIESVARAFYDRRSHGS